MASECLHNFRSDVQNECRKKDDKKLQPDSEPILFFEMPTHT